MIRQLSIYPDLLRLHSARPQRYPFLLESVAHGTAHARYDILFAFPGETLVLADNNAPHTPDFLQTLDDGWMRESRLSYAGRQSDAEAALPFSGGWFIYLGYELAAQIEPRLVLPATHREERPNRSELPIAFATRIPAAVIVDHHLQCTFLVAEDAHVALLDIMAQDLDHMRDDVASAKPLASALPYTSSMPPAVNHVQEDEPLRFLDGVQRVKEYIVDGDVFQVNLSRLYQATLAPDTTYVQLYQDLRKHNPAPFAGIALYNHDAQGRAGAKGSASAAGGRMPGAASAILSSSPERLVRIHDNVIEVRPIAGTRPRGVGDEDAALSQALLAHPKERAEHVMLIDLERNDLGRVCVPGSVQVDELMVLESYAHVHHIVSNVRGIKRSDVTPGQVIRAVFPGGTITGCPKVRCMEIIAELEQVARGPYTGAMGYLNHNGNMDLNILIRTMLVENDGVQFRVGAGIVADSVPDAELQETRAKARGLLLALGESEARGRM